MAVSFQVVIVGCLYSAPTSLARIMVVGPGPGGSTWHMVRLGIHRKCWSELLCLAWWLSRHLAPRPAAPSWGASPAGCARPTPLRQPPPPAGARPAGPWQELIWQFALQRLVGSRSRCG
jgi:hypothetical protein